MMPKLFNASLRMGSLALKLALTLYMGRYLGLTELGTYGLVASCVAIAIPLLGFRFDYIVSRDIVDASPLGLGCKMRDQAVFYGLNYLAVTLFLLFTVTYAFDDASIKIVIFILSLSIFESFATITSGNLVSLSRPILSNILFFIRASLWVFPVVALGIIDPSYRTADTVFEWWLGGVAFSLLITCFIWRNIPWREVLKIPTDWKWIKEGVKRSAFIWIGAVATAAAGNIDRFIVELNLGREFVGIASFYGSFVIAISALLSSGIFAFGYPNLITLRKQGHEREFYNMVWKMTYQAAASAGLLSFIVGFAVPLIGSLFERPEFTEHAPVLWLMLLGIWLKSSTESLHYVLYACHQDAAIWQGSLLLLGISLASNIVLIPTIGLIGIGYSAVISAVFLCLWRIHSVKSCVSFLFFQEQNKEEQL